MCMLYRMATLPMTLTDP